MNIQDSKEKKLNKINKKIRYWEKFMNKLEDKIKDNTFLIDEIEKSLKYSMHIAGVKVKLDNRSKKNLFDRLKTLDNQIRIDSKKKGQYLLFRNRWKTKKLALIDNRTPEEIDANWNNFWNSSPNKRTPTIIVGHDIPLSQTKIIEHKESRQ